MILLWPGVRIQLKLDIKIPWDVEYFLCVVFKQYTGELLSIRHIFLIFIKASIGKKNTPTEITTFAIKNTILWINISLDGKIKNSLWNHIGERTKDIRPLLICTNVYNYYSKTSLSFKSFTSFSKLTFALSIYSAGANVSIFYFNLLYTFSKCLLFHLLYIQQQRYKIKRVIMNYHVFVEIEISL